MPDNLTSMTSRPETSGPETSGPEISGSEISGSEISGSEISASVTSVYDAAIIGCGPAGCTAAIYLLMAGLNVCLIEKKEFPRETLCGEFLSMEVAEIIGSMGLEPDFLKLKPNQITSFRIINQNGKELTSELGFTGYGLKRGIFDQMLLKRAGELGASVCKPGRVTSITNNTEGFTLNVKAPEGAIQIKARTVIAAYGKQNILDKYSDRKFTDLKSGLNGLKFHIGRDLLPDFPCNEIQIYSGSGIYCGINMVDEETATVCFLEDRNSKSAPGKNHLMELMKENRAFAKIIHPGFFKDIHSFTAYGTGNIYFGRRELVTERGVFMAGDAAHVIAPLAGDGIGMAMQGGRLLAGVIIEQKEKNLGIDFARRQYSLRWNRTFSRRIRTALFIQKVLMNDTLRNLIFRIPLDLTPAVNFFIRHTRS